MSKKSLSAFLNEAQTSLFDENAKPETLPPQSCGGEKYEVYTDGSCLKNPDGPGGWAAILIDERGNRQEIKGGEKSTTNNRMELTAAWQAIAHTSPGAEVNLYTDSQYLHDAFVKKWLYKWQRNGWRTSDGGDVKNKDLWLKLYAEFSAHRVNFHWVRGHDGNEYNERCDVLAKGEAKKYW